MAGAPLRTRMVQERVRSGTRYAPLVSDLCTWRFLTIVLSTDSDRGSQHCWMRAGVIRRIRRWRTVAVWNFWERGVNPWIIVC